MKALKTYAKPSLSRVEMRPEEAVLAHCHVGIQDCVVQGPDGSEPSVTWGS
jgi:hypothetical protein